MVRNDIVDKIYEEMDKLLVERAQGSELTHEEAGLIIERLKAHIVESWISDLITHAFNSDHPETKAGDFYR